MIAVVDTSVALKWYVQESDSAMARPLLEVELAAPDFILVELANALWKKVRRGQITRFQADAALSHLAQAVKLVPSALVIEEALNLGLELAHPVYDCLYLALAGELRLPVVTADERFWRRLRGSRLAAGVVPLHEWES